MEPSILTLCYLIGSITFILGLKMLSNPASARNGNLIAAAGRIDLDVIKYPELISYILNNNVNPDDFAKFIHDKSIAYRSTHGNSGVLNSFILSK